MPTSINPPLLAISLAPTRHSHTLIEESGEFTVNIPTLEILQAVYACGSLTGRSFDKFKKTSLTQMPSKKIKAPAIRECVAHLECEVDGQFTTGDHTIFVGKILEAYADMGVFTEAGTTSKKRGYSTIRAETTLRYLIPNSTKPNRKNTIAYFTV